MRSRKIVILDYNVGNLFSVKHAFETLGIDSEITNSKEKILNADGLVLPGVGAFGDAMQSLKHLDLVIPILEFANSGKPLMGVCLGMQLLLERSEEFGNTDGLGLIKGEIKKFPSTINDKSIKVPQIGWNTIFNNEHNSHWDRSPLSSIPQNSFMYFVHSYYCELKNENSILSKTNYEGLEYCSSIQQDNIFAVQYHPEKSARPGLSIYRNWLKLFK
jgi:imidazole glycerol-phosphate synthase subunit HisH